VDQNYFRCYKTWF